MKWLWYNKPWTKKKLVTKHVPNELNIADIGTKGLTSDRIWKLMSQMGMSLGAGVKWPCAAASGENHWDVDT